ncbi:hypothetical protein NDU88_005865 [Pleurodeles waltl]|uniref:Uncharacterized protein n=1 Tax=Pleurodeles waltl TaxID=8319 RepID=A0AAV7UMA2_PLEWA|nr:hypothetical protein NDU88_005865 [Pleurodeles waltl]
MRLLQEAGRLDPVGGVRGPRGVWAAGVAVAVIACSPPRPDSRATLQVNEQGFSGLRELPQVDGAGRGALELQQAAAACPRCKEKNAMRVGEHAVQDY